MKANLFFVSFLASSFLLASLCLLNFYTEKECLILESKLISLQHKLIYLESKKTQSLYITKKINLDLDSISFAKVLSNNKLNRKNKPKDLHDKKIPPSIVADKKISDKENTHKLPQDTTAETKVTPAKITANENTDNKLGSANKRPNLLRLMPGKSIIFGSNFGSNNFNLNISIHLIDIDLSNQKATFVIKFPGNQAAFTIKEGTNRTVKNNQYVYEIFLEDIRKLDNFSSLAEAVFTVQQVNH